MRKQLGLGLLGLAVALSAVFAATPWSAVSHAQTSLPQIAINKQVCESIGTNNTCNGRDTSAAGQTVQFTIYRGETAGQNQVGTVGVVLDRGGGSQGSELSAGLPTGTYTVCETDPRFLATPRPDESSGGVRQNSDAQCLTVDLTESSQNAQLKFLNVRTAQLTLSKVCIGGTTGTFVIDVTDTRSGTTNTQQVTLACGQGTATPIFVAPGQVTIRETSGMPPAPGDVYITCNNSTVNGPSPLTLTVTAGQNVNCTVVNTFPAQLTLTKTCVGAPAGSGSFNVDVADTVNTRSQTLTCGQTGDVLYVRGPGLNITETTTNLPTGTSVSISCTNPTQASTTNTIEFNNIAAGQAVACTITNTFPGQVTVTKTCAGAPAGASFGVTVGGTAQTLTCGQPGSAVSVSPGSVTITETSGAPGAGGSVAISCNTNPVSTSATSSITISVAAGQNIACTITNTFPGEVTVAKSCQGAPQGAMFGIQVGNATTQSIPCNGMTTPVAVGAGSVTISETSGAPGTGGSVSISCNNTSPASTSSTSSITITVAAGQSVACTVTNTFPTTVTVVKTCQNVAPSDTTQFTLVIGSGIGSTQTATCTTATTFTRTVTGNQPITVGEQLVPANFTASINCTGGVATSASAGTVSITPPVGSSTTCTVTNTFQSQQAGCTPGYYKTNGQYPTGVTPTTTFQSVFGTVQGVSPLTFDQALDLNGGGTNALIRHAAAAYLNALNAQQGRFGTATYPYTPTQVISMFQAAISSGNIEATKNLFAAANELGCPLSAAPTRGRS